jgi:TRAP-type mannitol/chloroaromatic compound transport system permease small subunit
MQRFLLSIDRLSMLVGHVVSWSIVLLTGVVVYSILMRRFFDDPPLWSFDAAYMLYGVLFMMGGAYALSRNAHVRGDMFYREWSPRTQAIVDLTLYIVFFYPGILALVWSGWEFAEISRARNEYSNASPGGPLIWPFKYVIPVSAFFMLVQGVVETIRCVIAIRDGYWPQRLADVEETETRLAKESQF